MRRLLLALPFIALLAVAPAAFAGGWATVGLSSTPAGTQPGQPWNVSLTILQHGRTPLDGLEPKLTIRNGDATKTFIAKPTGKPGVYRAAVVFPTAGTWEYSIEDGFLNGMAHTYPAVNIGGSAPAAAPAAPATTSGGGTDLSRLAIPGIALMLASVALLVWDRRRRHHPQAA